MADKGYKGIGMNGIIARWYAKSTGKSYEEYKELAERIKNILNDGSSKDILEVAPGPGYLSIELAKEPNFNVTGLDISETFVQLASQNAKENHVAVNFVLGNASEMPFNDGIFDLIICRAAFKNFSKPLQAMNEMFRVLKPAGKALIIDLRKDISDQEIASYVKKANLGMRDSLLTSSGLKQLRKWAYSIEGIEQMSRDSRFRKHQIETSPTGFELWLEK